MGLARIKLGQSQIAKNNFVIALKELEKWNSVNSIIDKLDNTLVVLADIKMRFFNGKLDPHLNQIIELLENARDRFKSERIK